jgi:hypothetical protein
MAARRSTGRAIIRGLKKGNPRHLLHAVVSQSIGLENAHGQKIRPVPNHRSRRALRLISPCTWNLAREGESKDQQRPKE